MKRPQHACCSVRLQHACCSVSQSVAVSCSELHSCVALIHTGFRVDLNKPIFQEIDAINLTARNVEPITTFRWLFGGVCHELNVPRTHCYLGLCVWFVSNTQCVANTFPKNRFMPITSFRGLFAGVCVINSLCHELNTFSVTNSFLSLGEHNGGNKYQDAFYEGKI